MNANLTTLRNPTTAALGATAVDIGTPAMSAPATAATNMQPTCEQHPELYAAGATLGVYSTQRRGVDRDRVVLELAYRQGLDGPELADALGVPRTHEETPETATPVTTRPKPSPQQDDEDEQQPAPVIDPPKNEPTSDAPSTTDSPVKPKPKLPTKIPPQEKLEPDCPPQDDTCNGGGGPVIS